MAKRDAQLSFTSLVKQRDCFGGSLLKKSHAKTRRPLTSKYPIHVVLRATQSGMRRPGVYHQVHKVINNTARAHGVRIYEYANVHNHVHLLIKLSHVRRWAAFIRALSGRIAQVSQGLRGRARGGESFWMHRPFTRVVRGWGRAYRTCKRYVQLNELEAQGEISRHETKDLAALLAIYGIT